MKLSKLNKGLLGLLVLAVMVAGASFMKRQPQQLEEGWHHGAFMEIFVRSYKDSNGDGIGDLKGLIQSLDHLKDLGIKGIWLMPITASADRDHGYATRDFRNIEPDYGTLADFDELIKEAHKRGIGIIMDYVLNHSAKEHPFFEDALKNPNSPYRAWYEWRNEKPQGWDIWGRDPWIATTNGSYLATFGAPMPDFNMRNPEVVKYHEESLKFWLDRGIDGFRLDAVPHLIEKDAKDWNDQPESRQLTGQFTRLIKSYPNKYVVCEATAEPKVYARTDICGGAFAFGLENQISKAAKGETEAIQKVAQYYTQAPHTLASFASNHDQFAGKRLWDQVNGNEVHYKLAAATYLLLPGTPFIYYGEEIGMAGAKGLTDDPFIRGPYSWLPNEATAGFTTGQPYRAVSGNVSTHHAQIQKAGADSLWSFYRDMVALRNTRTSLAKGSYEAAQAQGQVLTYQRKAGQEHSVVVINYGAHSVPLTIEGIASNATLRALYPAKGVANQKDGQVTVPAQSVYVFAVEK
jgi:glycosidase